MMMSSCARGVSAVVLLVASSACQTRQPQFQQETCAPSQFEGAHGYYSQFYEDYILGYVFAGQAKGFYVDVGANDPDVRTTTKLFYDKGWSGVNIEPNAIEFAKIEKSRPRDRNFNYGVSDGEATMTFYAGKGWQDGVSTFDSTVAEALRQKGFELTEHRVPVTTLTSLLSTVSLPEISFMSIDVEGFEGRVIKGLDLARFRPVVFCIEATKPETELPAYDEWEPALLKAGLMPRFIFVDGCVKTSKYHRHVKLDGWNRWQ